MTSLKEIREVVAEIEASATQDHTVLDDAADLLRALHDEIGSLRARLAHVRQIREHIDRVIPDHPGGTEQDNGRWSAYDDVRERLDEALDGMAW